MRLQLIRFGIAGVAGFLVDTGILYLALWAGCGYFAGRALSFLCAVWVTWRINRRYTFAVDRSESVWVEWWKYLVAMSAGGTVNYAAYSAAVLGLRGGTFLPILSVAIGSIAGMAVNYLTARLWVFRPR
jgi:putative flippase GtrA